MKKITQTQAVIEVMKRKGGYATLLDLYREVTQVKNVEWKTKTPDASIRRIVQDQRYFFKIRPGLWALNEYKDILPNNIISLMEVDKPNSELEFNVHSYHQGLLIDSGNMLGFNTYVPAQDKNRKFLDKTLSDMVSFTELPQFTYSEILNRIKSIDVIWLESDTETPFPKKVFEVENTTDFTKSLNKFNELKSFDVEMIIVAPHYREKSFLEIINWGIYKGLKSRIEYWDYDKLEKTYSYYNNRKITNLLF
jgi:hypothetical protein